VKHIDPVHQSRILIVDDEEANTLLLERILQRSGYEQIHSTNDAREVLHLFARYQPDLVLLDLMMPFVSGFEILEMIQQIIPRGTFLPVLILTADLNPETKQRALSMGAKDFLTKPFDMTEVMLRVQNLLETRSLHRMLLYQKETLEEMVLSRTHEVEEARLETLERLARAAEYRDDDTGEHTQRVGINCALIARELGLPEEHIDIIRQAAPLHDVGKIGIHDNILLKPARLTPEEFAEMKTHTMIGATILSGSRYSVLKTGEMIARSHHERWDGSGYPDGTSGEAIPIEARIVTVVDIFDALIHDRPYKTAWPVAEAVAELECIAGTHCDPEIIRAFVAVYQRKQILA
jgi:putative two-component system response regulator